MIRNPLIKTAAAAKEKKNPNEKLKENKDENWVYQEQQKTWLGPSCQVDKSKNIQNERIRHDGCDVTM